MKINYNYNTDPQGVVKIKTEKRDYNLARIIEIIDNLLKKKNNIKIFEPGCGGGRNLDFLKMKYGDSVKVFGTDISKTSINYVQGKISGEFVIAKTIDDCFSEEFDLIIMLDILEHLSSISEVEETIKLAKKRINKDGVLFISCPIELNKYSICWFFSKINFWKDVTLKYYGHTIQFTESEILRLVVNHFRIKNINYNLHFFSQIRALLFFYLPKQVLSFLGGKKTVSLFRDSNTEIYFNDKPKQFFLKFLLNLLPIISSPLSFIGFYESMLRRKSKLGAMVINIECY